MIWTHSEWLLEYELLGLIPGSSVDAKIVANGYGFPLVGVTGRCHDGHLLVFAMGYLIRVDTETFRWFFEAFLEMAKKQLRLTITDQDAAMITATSEEWPCLLYTSDAADD